MQASPYPGLGGSGKADAPCGVSAPWSSGVRSRSMHQGAVRDLSALLFSACTSVSVLTYPCGTRGAEAAEMMQCGLL